MKSVKGIEIEFRARFDAAKYEELKRFLDKNADNLGEDDKDVHFFIMPDKLLKVVDNVSKGDAKGLPSGVYFYRLEAKGIVQTRKMILLK